MTVEHIVVLVLEKGITTVLAGLMIYALLQAIKYAPKVFREMLNLISESTKATENSTQAIKKSNELQEDTKVIHDNMDKKIDKLQKMVEDLKADVLVANNSNLTSILDKLNEIMEDVKSLKGGN